MQNQAPTAPQQRLELSLNAEDGSLQAAPLLTVLLASTDGLYTDIYDMAHGELDVTTTAQAAATDDGNDNDVDEQDGSGAVQKKERMSNLSFAQRRHELAWRLAQHSRGLTHVAALTAAAASTDLANATRVSSQALQRARSAWVQADEAQDALYFFHAQLFPARWSPHDVYGALDVMLRGTWIDLPDDIKLIVDRYRNSSENSWSASELAHRWHLAVRDKLLRGEVGWMRLQGVQSQWKLSLRGGVVRVTHGTEKIMGNQPVYPIEAQLTVFSTTVPAEWTLLSVEVRAQAKTGESSHQLDTTNRQRYDLHRLCALAMAREERRAREERQNSVDDDDDANSAGNSCIARPLHRLFQVAQKFGLSWQLGILSAQAQALRRGVWASGEANPIVVTPVQFFESGDILGVVFISFWSVDGQYGPPRMGDLSLTKQWEQGTGGLDPPVTNQLTLSVRAEGDLGIRVSLSGGESIMESVNDQQHCRLAITNLLEASSNPFGLSASDVLLAATSLCAERKCHSIVQALEPRNGKSMLPRWIHLHVERGSIGVSANIYCDGNGRNELSSFNVVLFRLACDARTGNFVPTFSRSMWLLRSLACNDLSASEANSLQIAKLAQNRRKGVSGNSSGRFVRDSFEGLSRSVNALGQKTGVGGPWCDVDKMSASLRFRAIQTSCADVRESLVTCCVVATAYGFSALALGIASGVSASADL
jgi:hypothetical protein